MLDQAPQSPQSYHQANSMVCGILDSHFVSIIFQEDRGIWPENLITGRVCSCRLIRFDSLTCNFIFDTLSTSLALVLIHGHWNYFPSQSHLVTLSSRARVWSSCL